MQQTVKARLSAAVTASGLLFLMWAFLMLPAFGDEGLTFRLGTAAMGIYFMVVAARSGKLKSRLEIYTLAVSGALGIVIFAIGLIANLLR